MIIRPFLSKGSPLPDALEGADGLRCLGLYLEAPWAKLWVTKSSRKEREESTCSRGGREREGGREGRREGGREAGWREGGWREGEEREKREEETIHMYVHTSMYMYIHVYNVCIYMYIVPPGPHRLSPEGGQSASWPDLERVPEAHYISDEGGREGGREGRREGGKEGG